MRSLYGLYRQRLPSPKFDFSPERDMLYPSAILALPWGEHMKQPYIVIEGAIGVGKTTLARMLGDQFHNHLMLEVFEENPFLAKFYESRARYAFQTQIFFLLSRYRQQTQVPQILARGGLISDYMFAKDRLFARLNLTGDEWDIYEQLHTALAQQLADPDLIVYLQADTEVLMGRIAQRDRPYERDMDWTYIDTLREAYDRYFAAPNPKGVPVLTIDTNSLNIVTHPADFQLICERIESFLGQEPRGPRKRRRQAQVPTETYLTQGRPLADLQEFHEVLDASKGFNKNVYFNYLRLSEEIGELGSELATIWRLEEGLQAEGQSVENARAQAIDTRHQALESELADCMAYLLKLANYTGIELESAYLNKMRENVQRDWQ